MNSFIQVVSLFAVLVSRKQLMQVCLIQWPDVQVRGETCVFNNNKTASYGQSQIQFKPFYEHKKCTVLYSFYFNIWYNRYWIFNTAFVVAGYLIAPWYGNPTPQVNQPNESYIYKRQRTDKNNCYHSINRFTYTQPKGRGLFLLLLSFIDLSLVKSYNVTLDRHVRIAHLNKLMFLLPRTLTASGNSRPISFSRDMAPPEKKDDLRNRRDKLWDEKVKEGEQIKIFYILEGKWKGEELLEWSILTRKCCNNRKW